MLNRFVNRCIKFTETSVLLSRMNMEGYNGKSKGIANPSRVMDNVSQNKTNKQSSGFQNVPNILIRTNNDELYMTLAATLKNVLDASKVYKNYIRLFDAYFQRW